MKHTKKLLALALCVITVLSLFTFPAFADTAENNAVILASSKPKQLTTINNFRQELTEEQYDVLRNGSYSAQKSNGTWYYKFSTKKYYVLVKTTAFASVSNDFSALNTDLTKGINNHNYSYNPIYIYKDGKTYQETKFNGGNTSLQYSNNRNNGLVTITKNDVYLSKLQFMSSLSNDTIVLKCKMGNHVLFTYADKVPKKPYAEYVTPSTAEQYERALNRQTGSVSWMFTPQLNVTVDKPGSSKIQLKEFRYQMEGEIKKQKNVGEWIKLTYTLGSVAWNTAVKGLSVSSLYSLYNVSLDLQKSSKRVFKLNGFERLSGVNSKGNSCSVLRANFKSPVKMKSDGDYFQVELHLNTRPSFSGSKKTVFSVKFGDDCTIMP